MMKTKRTFSILLVLCLTMAMFTACGNKNEGGKDAPADASGALKKIGVIQLVEHNALDQSYQGFVDGLKEAGYEDGKNIKIDLQNAQGEQSNCETIASKLVNDKSDMILAIATPAAQAVAAKTKDIPVLVTAVTDPASSGLVKSNEAPGGNISGTSDLTPVKEQIELLTQILPDAKKIAILYCSAEDNSIFQAGIAKTEAEAAGLEWEEATVSNTNEVQSVVQSLVGKVDAIYIPTDNMLAKAMTTVTMVANENNLPCIVGEAGMVENGGLATYGINYYNLGKMTAKQAVDILEGKATTTDMPIGYLSAEECELKINTETATQLGITIPQELLDKVAK